MALPNLRSQKVSCEGPKVLAQKTQYLKEAATASRIILKVLLDKIKFPSAGPNLLASHAEGHFGSC